MPTSSFAQQASATTPSSSSTSGPAMSSSSSSSGARRRIDDLSTSPILNLESFPPTGTPKHEKLGSYDFYRSIGSPRFVVAPMVDQSELAWRILSRRHGADLVYTPMIHSKMYMEHKKARIGFFDKATGEEGCAKFQLLKAEKGKGREEEADVGVDTDRPLIAQFCGNDPDTLLAAAKSIQQHCDAVDLNLGCPQGIAKRGNYGAFLQSDWQLIFRLINTLHLELKVPVTAKMRVFTDLDRTVAYARMLERAGAQIITVHGRTREMKGQLSGLADWDKIRAVKEAVKVPVFANGNILFRQDVTRALERTGADGVMSAEGNLYNPCVFHEPGTDDPLYPLAPIYPFPDLIMLCNEYLDIVSSLKTKTSATSVKGHMFKLTRPALEVHPDLRRVFGPARLEGSGEEGVRQYREAVAELARRLEADRRDERYTSRLLKTPVPLDDYSSADAIITANTAPYVYVPHWLAQPYFRPNGPPKLAGEGKRKSGETRGEEATTESGRSSAMGTDTSREEGQEEEGVVKIRDEQTRGERSLLSQESGDTGEGEGSRKKLRTALEEAQTLKAMANSCFAEADYDGALVHYNDALARLPPRETLRLDEERDVTDADEADVKGKARQVEDEDDNNDDDEEAENKIKTLRAIIYANVAACRMKLESWQEAVEACNQSLLDDENYIKALHRRAQSNEKLGTWTSLTSAQEDYKRILTLPNHPPSLRPSLLEALARLPGEIETVAVQEKEEMMSKLKGVGDSVLGWFGLSTDNFQMKKGQDGGYSLNFVR